MRVISRAVTYIWNNRPSLFCRGSSNGALGCTSGKKQQRVGADTPVTAETKVMPRRQAAGVYVNCCAICTDSFCFVLDTCALRP